tara:strand:+ start:458 stop:1183 length:726 start_codon:yes stop_codon:yes gene_type:complete
MKKFIFDVDGTLTPSRKHMNLSFMAEFIIFCCKYDTYLVTGSDREKTIEQVGLDVYNRSKRVFQCSGADIYEKNRSIWKSKWEPSYALEKFLEGELEYSTFPHKTGNHIERRPGGINFSILGRGELNFDKREDYKKWDRNTSERKNIASRIKLHHPELNVQIGGETGLDISDEDKSQIIKFFSPSDEIHFFGDMMEEGQNDYPLGEAVKEWGGYLHPVEDWRDTRSQLDELSEQKLGGYYV